MDQRPYLLDTQITKRLRLPYLLALPDGYDKDPARQYPLIVSLHGAGERGDDLQALPLHGIPRIVREGAPLTPFPFITLCPQCAQDTTWRDHMDEVRALLDATVAEYRVDRSRIYLTGYSMGGSAIWDWAADEPKRFAAIVPICGRGDPFHGFPYRVSALLKTPIWVFHGALDDEVPLTESATLVKILHDWGGNVRFTVYPYTAHDCWTETYANPELYEWLLQHTRGR